MTESKLSPLHNRRLGLVGAGNMAGALVRGLIASGSLGREQIRASDVLEERRRAFADDHGVVTSADNAELARWANLIVIAVKPQVIDVACAELASGLSPDALVVSIAAGVPLRALEPLFPASTRIVRAMPNTAAIALAGATAISPGSHASADDLAAAFALFEAVGRVVVVEEPQLDAVTGLSGSGPAYIMLVIEALADGGVKSGLSRDTALTLAAQTVYGSAKLLLETGEQPARLKEMVTSPGGTTIAGLKALESGGLGPALVDAVESATRRARELGRDAVDRLAKRG